MSRREGQKKKQTEAVRKKRVPGMMRTCKSNRWERRRGSELAAAEPDSRTMQSRDARRAALLGNPSRGMRRGHGGEADQRMRLQEGREIKERKDKGEQACTDRPLERCCTTAPKRSAKGVRKQGGVCTRLNKSGGDQQLLQKAPQSRWARSWGWWRRRRWRRWRDVDGVAAAADREYSPAS